MTPRWEAGPPSWQGWGQLALAALLLAGVPLADPVGRVLLLPAAVLLVVLGSRDLVLAPVLTADHQGLTVVDGFRRRTATWGHLRHARVVTDRRAPLLELDLDDVVVVLSRRRLGQPPALALQQLEALRPG
jgi:hypothetical protein